MSVPSVYGLPADLTQLAKLAVCTHFIHPDQTLNLEVVLQLDLLPHDLVYIRQVALHILHLYTPNHLLLV